MRCVIEAAPHHEERVGNHVFGAIRISAALNEFDQVRVDRLVQRHKPVLLLSRAREVSHTQYLSATCASVSQQVLLALLFGRATIPQTFGQPAPSGRPLSGM
ncbi:MAG: hypothetical protein M3Y73_11920 [Actinomycetota bacterium]|nr:hypothetical protein [Actinomycetota bacterium]